MDMEHENMKRYTLSPLKVKTQFWENLLGIFFKSGLFIPKSSPPEFFVTSRAEQEELGI